MLFLLCFHHIKPSVLMMVIGSNARYTIPPFRPLAPFSPRLEAVLVQTEQPCAHISAGRQSIAIAATTHIIVIACLFIL